MAVLNCGSLSIRVSIIITNFNYLRYLPAAIESVRAQQPDELIVVDDGSTDGSVEWLRATKGIARLICKPNGGQASAMNAGFEKCTGDLVWFMDADDVLFPGAIAAVKQIWRSGISKTHLRCNVIDQNGRIMRFLPAKWRALPSGNVAGLYKYLGYYPSVPTSANVYSRQFVQEVFPIPEEAYRICADAYLHDLAPWAGRIAAISAPLVGYRIHQSNNFAGQRMGRDEAWIRQKVQRLLKKWHSIWSLGGKPAWLVRSIFILSPDYLDTTKKLGMTSVAIREHFGEMLPMPGKVFGAFLYLLKVSWVNYLYRRIWLTMNTALYYIFKS